MFCCTNIRTDNENKNTINLLKKYLMDDSGRKHQIIKKEHNFTWNENKELIDREYLELSRKQSAQPSFLSYEFRQPKK